MRLNTILFLAFAASGFLAAAENPAEVDPADQRIADAQKALRSNPGSADSHLNLAAELCRKARDSEDIAYYGQAEAEVESALKLAPGNYDAKKLEVTILLGRNEFDAALKLAAELNKKIPDDIALWGLLAQIHAAIGNYQEAVRDAQWVLDLRPGSALGFTEAARLREAYGDAEGAIEFYDEARRRTALSDAEERAWLLTQVARLTGDKKRAGALFEEARKTNPASQLAIAGLARLRMTEGNYSEVVALLEKRFKVAHSARNLYDLAEALEGAGRKDEAASAFQEFETKALGETERPYNANIELIGYYLDRKSNPAEALAIAKRESAVRHDSRTMAALAWALFANSRYEEARMRMEDALATGQRNAGYFCHAAHIAAALNDAEHAKEFQKESLSLDSGACSVELPVASLQEGKK